MKEVALHNSKGKLSTALGGWLLFHLLNSGRIRTLFEAKNNPCVFKNKIIILSFL